MEENKKPSRHDQWNDLPSSIKYPETFIRTLPPGSDGVFDWSWSSGATKGTNISPMDLDGIIEKNGNFIIFETKNPGVPVALGQRITLTRLYENLNTTVVIIQGKIIPEMIKTMCQDGFRNGQIMLDFSATTRDRMVKLVNDWMDYAIDNPKNTKFVD